MRRSWVVWGSLPLLPALHAGCGDDRVDGSGSGGIGPGGSGPETGGIGESDITVGEVTNLGGMPPTEQAGGAGNPFDGPYSLPEGYEEATRGGWLVTQELEEGEVPASSPGSESDEGCGTEILGIVRDFRRGDDDWDGHPDFQTYAGDGEKGIVEQRLGDDKKPVHAEGDHEFTTTPEDFDLWYRTTEGENRAFLTSFSFEPNDGVLTFQSSAFFPIDDMGFGNQEFEHNYHFTTEVHTEFVYQGGETFRFEGDDDLWVFIDEELVIDLGGLHPAQESEVDLDSLGLTEGEVYSLDLFHAERRTAHSNFRVDTTLKFTNCGIIVDDGIVK